jgi:molecular chaperone DnaJ
MASQDWFDKDFYKILGVAKGVSEAELKKTYRKLSRQFHPDTNPGDAKAEARFKEISEAYSALSDKDQRAEYDQMRAMGPGARAGFGGNGGGGFPGGGANFGGAGFEDVFANLFGGGGGGFGGPRGPQRGQDLTTSQTLDFIDGVKGTTIKLSLRSGAEPTTIKIPAGVSDGQKIKIAGKGNPSPNGGPAGDLIITVSVKSHPVFTRDGNNIRVVVPITFAEAVLGATIQVPTLGGDPVKLKVAPGTPNGRVLRVKGRGVVTAKAEGDLLATVEIAVPSHVSDKAKQALEEFDGLLPDEDPRADLLIKAGLL